MIYLGVLGVYNGSRGIYALKALTPADAYLFIGLLDS